MKHLFLFLILLLIAVTSHSAVMRGQDGRWYGNICMTQTGWQQVPWQLVGTTCYAPMLRQYGFIANV